MSKVAAGATMSLDGFIAGPNESGFEHLFAWYSAGDHEYASTHPEIPFVMTESDLAYFRKYLDATGVFVVGRRLFDLTDGWGGTHPSDKPIVVVTHRDADEWVAAHPDAPFTFVGGIKEALDAATEIAGDKMIGVAGGEMARQFLEADLLDELWVDLAPVILGAGVPLLGPVAGAPIVLRDPDVQPGTRVTHLHYRIR